MNATMTVCTGAGYGPVSITVPDPITGESLAAAARDGRVTVMAYAPNAGHILDDHHVDVITDMLGARIEWHTEHNPLTPIRVGTVDAADPVACEIAADILSSLTDYPILDEDRWSAAEYEYAYTLAADECRYAGITDVDAVWGEVMAGAEPYYTDNGGTYVPELDDIVTEYATRQTVEG